MSRMLMTPYNGAVLPLSQRPFPYVAVVTDQTGMLRIVLPSASTPPRLHRNQPRAGGLPRFPLKPFDNSRSFRSP